LTKSSKKTTLLIHPKNVEPIATGILILQGIIYYNLTIIWLINDVCDVKWLYRTRWPLFGWLVRLTNLNTSLFYIEL